MGDRVGGEWWPGGFFDLDERLQRLSDLADQRYLIWKACAEKSDEWQAQERRRKVDANRARSEAAQERPRAASGVFEAQPVRPQAVDTQGSKRGQGTQEKAAASSTNRGAVERMADEVDEAQERGEVARPDGSTHHRFKEGAQTSDTLPPTLDDLGLDRRRLSEWREVRDAGEDAVYEAVATIRRELFGAEDVKYGQALCNLGQAYADT
ncbi:MAG: hypothetical protein AAFY56_10405, partial [Pseudomonadota bacterium]